MPVFDIRVAPQKRSAYSRLSQNELALQFYGLGFFDPSRVNQVMMALDMMEFDGKAALQNKIGEAATMQKELLQWQEMALRLAARYEPQLVQGLSEAIAPGTGEETAAPSAQAIQSTVRAPMEEARHVQRARSQAQSAPLPGGGV